MISAAAYKYGCAFLNVFSDTIQRDDIAHMQEAVHYFDAHKKILFFLRVPLISDAIKIKNITLLCDRFGISHHIIELFKLLLQRKQAFLIAQVLKAIIHEYNRRHGIETIRITTSCELTAREREQVVQLAESLFPGIKEYQYTVDPLLIAGIKMRSHTLQWERSIQQYLRDCAQAQIW